MIRTETHDLIVFFKNRMSDVDVESTYTYVGMRDKVVPDLPDNAVKEHLSIVNCGHDVG